MATPGVRRRDELALIVPQAMASLRAANSRISSFAILVQDPDNFILHRFALRAIGEHLMYNRILVATDGSDTSSRACTEAISLASDQKARLRVLYVISYAYVSAILGGTYTGDLLRRLRTDAQGTLEATEAAARSAGLEVEPILLEHHSTQIGEAIVEDAHKWQAALIVMGTHGRRGFARAVIGSDAEYVARHTPVPLLLVRSHST